MTVGADLCVGPKKGEHLGSPLQNNYLPKEEKSIKPSTNQRQ